MVEVRFLDFQLISQPCNGHIYLPSLPTTDQQQISCLPLHTKTDKTVLISKHPPTHFIGKKS